MDGVAAPLAVLLSLLFSLDVQIHRAADNHQAKNDGQYRF